MNKTNPSNQYEQISFNKQTLQDNLHHQKYNLGNQERSTNELMAKIVELENALRKQKQKSSQLQKRNQQLTDMLVSASQSSVKRNQQFLHEVQRKIYNYKALKDLSLSTFRKTDKLGDKDNFQKRRISTQVSEQNSKKSISSYMEGFSSRATFDSNKENCNVMNDRSKIQGKYSLKNHNFESSTSPYCSQKVKKEKQLINKNENQSTLKQKWEIPEFNSSASPFIKKNDMKIFSKLESKLYRI